MKSPVPFPSSSIGSAHEFFGAEPELQAYRRRTRSLLRKYLVLAVETGRLPSLLGREFFRAKVTSYPLHSFEDAVIFVHDMEGSLTELQPFLQQLIAMIVLEEYTEEEAARILCCGLRTVERWYPEALDQLSDVLLRRGLLEAISCQEAKKPPHGVSCCEYDK